MACGNYLCAQNMKCMNPSTCEGGFLERGILPYSTPTPNVETGKEGWTCPKCNKVWAPFITECFTCNKDKLSAT